MRGLDPGGMRDRGFALRFTSLGFRVTDLQLSLVGNMPADVSRVLRCH